MGCTQLCTASKNIIYHVCDNNEYVSTSVEASEIKELLSYIDKMKEYDKRHFVRLQEINDIVWGILFIFAGVMDVLFFSSDSGDLSMYPWLIASFSGMGLSLFINRKRPQDFTSEEVEARTATMRRVYTLSIVATIIAWIAMMIIMVLYQLFFLIMPIVGFLIGTVFIVLSWRYGVEIKALNFLNPRYKLQFVPTMAYLSVIVNLVGYLITPEFHTYMGLVLGTFVGSAFLITTFVDQKI